MPPLRGLVEAGHDVAIAVTQPDRRRSRRGEPEPTPVKRAALELGIPVTTRVRDVVAAGVERGVVVAFGRLIRPDVLAAVPMVNIHFSLLPRWRGAAPLERAILAGDRETGVCLMELEEGLDTGPVYACRRVPIGANDTLSQLRAQLVTLGTELLLEELGRGLSDPVPQDGEPTYAEKIDPDELRLRWDAPAEEVHRVVRLERAWTTFRGRRLRILSARVVDDAPPPGVLMDDLVGCAVGGLRLLTVQPEGKGPMDAASWRNGARPSPGERLGE